MPRLLILLVITGFIAGCAAGGGAPQSAPAPAMPVFDLPLPADTPREAGALIYLSVNGDNPHEYSDDPTIGEGRLEMAAAAGSLEYAIYRLNTSGHPLLGIEVNLAVMSGEGCWLAIADYGSMTWEVSGPHGSGTLINNEPEPQWISPDNNLFVAVIAHDSTTVSVNRVLAAVDFAFWQKHTIEGEGDDNCGRWSSLKELAGRPAVSYHHDTLGALRFAYAESAEPTGDSWSIMSADPGSETMHVGSHTSLAIVDGRPLIAYASPSHDQLRIATTELAEPGETDWSSYELDLLIWQPGGCLSLAAIGGLPAVAYVEFEPGHHLRYAYASQAVPALEDWTLTDGDAPAADFSYLSLVEVNGLPAVSRHLWGAPGNLEYSACGSTAPGGADDWQTHTVTAVGEFGIAACSMVNLDGNPAIACLDPTAELAHLSIAGSPSPTSPEDWEKSTIDNRAAYAEHTALALVGDRPCVAYWDPAAEEVWCAWAKTTAPAAPSDWAFSVIDWGLGPTGGHVSVAAIGGLPAVTYYDGEDRDLMYARQVPPAP